MRTLFLKLYYLYALIASLFYFMGYLVWHLRKPENAYEKVLESIAEYFDHKQRYSSKRYDEKLFEKFKIRTSIIITLILILLIIAFISIKTAIIIIVFTLILALIISLIVLAFES